MTEPMSPDEERQRLTAEASRLAGVAERLDTTGVPALRREFQSSSTWVKRLLAAVLVVVGLLAGGVGIQLYNAHQEGKRRALARAQVAKTADTADRIRSCTDPQGQCYKDAQARTAGAIAQLVLSDVRVSECVVASGGAVPMFKACVKAKGLPVE